eukprot:2130937-Karenia_brevis.AAC.1
MRSADKGVIVSKGEDAAHPKRKWSDFPWHDQRLSACKGQGHLDPKQPALAIVYLDVLILVKTGVFDVTSSRGHLRRQSSRATELMSSNMEGLPQWESMSWLMEMLD